MFWEGEIMDKQKIKEMVLYATLAVLTIFLCRMVCGRERVFGSNTDWISQHSVFLDYFRQQFYETGEIFPQFAANIGGGQNIYNFAYYGLYSPVVFISYFFPFVQAGEYLMAASVCSLGAALLIFYRWLRKRGIGKDISFLCSIIFLLAAPMVYHSCKQVMFVNYMPFLCLAFVGIDAYFEKKKTGLYTISVFLMIMTSFYFSICGILVLTLYGLFRYLQIHEETGKKLKFFHFIADGAAFLLPVITAVLMSGVLLVPTAMTLTGSRDTKKQIRVLEMFMPDVKIFRFLYTPYGIGLSTFAVTVLITGVTYKKYYEKFIHMGCILVLTMPFFVYVLNGGLYVRDKVMIPFLPLLLFLMATYVEKQKRGEICFFAGALPFLLSLLLLYLGKEQAIHSKYGTLAFMDGIVMALCFFIFYRKKCYRIFLSASIVFLSFGVYKNVDRESLVSREFYRQICDETTEKEIREIAEKETGFYRIEQRGTGSENLADINRIWDMGQYSSSLYSSSFHAGYRKFRKDTFMLEQPNRNIFMQPVSENPVFQRLMGVKYIVSKEDIVGYEKCKTSENVHIYKREDVLPVAYVTDRVIGESTYGQLEFPYNQQVLWDYAVAGTGEEQADMKDKLGQELVSLEPEILKCFDAEDTMEKTKDGYHMQTDKRRDVFLNILKPGEGDTLFLQFEVKNNRKSKDVSLWVENVENKLSSATHIYSNENRKFTYAINLEQGKKEILFGFGPGDYEICNIKCFLGKFRDRAEKLCQAKVDIDKNKTKGNEIVGSVHVEKKGYLITSIPYEDNFEVELDGKKVSYERVNTAFLGMKIDRGRHEIRIVYHAPGFLAGKWMSVFGMLCFFFLLLCHKRDYSFTKKY